MFRLQCKSFFRNIWMPIALGTVLLGTLLYPLNYFPAVTPAFTRTAWTYLQVSQETVLICFTVFLFISFEFFSQMQQSATDEALSSQPNGLKSYYLSRSGVLVLFAAALTIMNMLLTTIGFFVVPMEPAVLFHMLLSIFLNYFCTCVVAVLIGLAFSLLRNRLISYILIVLMVLFGSQLANQLLGVLAADGVINLFGVYRLFHFEPPNISFEANIHIGTSLLPWRWMLLGFWSASSLAIAATVILKGKGLKPRRIATQFICCVLATGFACGVLFPGSTITFDRDPEGSILEGQRYYADISLRQKQKSPGFIISGYTLDLKIRNQLYAKATLSLIPTRAERFPFTLYHTYKIRSAQDQDGTLLPFQQDGDYIEVKNVKGREITSITFFYQGYSPAFYSNLQGVCLPGSFPYYPQPGFQWLTENGKPDRSIRSFALPEEVPISVSLNAPYPVFSNLEAGEKKKFQGMADGITLISGFLKQETVDGILITYPSSMVEIDRQKISDDIQHMDKIFRQAKAQNAEIPDWRRKSMIVSPMGNSKYGEIWMRDQIITTYPLLSESYAKQFRKQGINIHVEGIREDD